MQSRKMASVAAAMALCVAHVAQGGARFTGPVIVDVASSYASGYLGSAYNTSNSSEFIGCTVVYGSGNSYATCSAANSAGVYRGCTTTSPSMIAAIRSLDENAAISFSWDANSTCTMVTSAQYSFLDPKVWGGYPR